MQLFVSQGWGVVVVLRSGLSPILLEGCCWFLWGGSLPILAERRVGAVLRPSWLGFAAGCCAVFRRLS